MSSYTLYRSQTEIQFFWSLTEQIELDLDYRESNAFYYEFLLGLGNTT
jgi:hypothetical protein